MCTRTKQKCHLVHNSKTFFTYALRFSLFRISTFSFFFFFFSSSIAGNPDTLICGNCRECFTELAELLDHKRSYCKLRFTCKCQDVALAASMLCLFYCYYTCFCCCCCYFSYKLLVTLVVAVVF